MCNYQISRSACGVNPTQITKETNGFVLTDRHFVPNKCDKGAKVAFQIINSLKVESH